MSTASKKLSTRDLVLIALFAALMAVCAWITIPVPSIPFTLQIFAIFAALFTLGGKRGTIAIIIYILIGAIGVPVFSGFSGGIGVLLGVTGGYIVGFAFSGLVYWLITSLVKKEKKWVSLVAAAAALIVCYVFGSIWFMVVYLTKSGAIGFWSVLTICVIPYIIPDVVKIALAYALSQILKKTIKTI